MGQGGKAPPGSEAGSWEGGFLLPPWLCPGLAGQTCGSWLSTLPRTTSQDLASRETALGLTIPAASPREVCFPEPKNSAFLPAKFCPVPRDTPLSTLPHPHPPLSLRFFWEVALGFWERKGIDEVENLECVANSSSQLCGLGSKY